MHEEYTPNKISHIDDRRVAHNNDQGKCTTCISNPYELCYFTTRKKFIEKCLPFNNFFVIHHYHILHFHIHIYLQLKYYK